MAEKPLDSRYPATLNTLGDRLRAKRLDLGLTQKDVASLLGVSEDTICYWENNPVQPSKHLLPRIEDFIDGKTLSASLISAVKESDTRGR